MNGQGRVGKLREALWGVVAGLALMCAGAAQAQVVTGQGTRFNGPDPLQGRDINGIPVPLLVSGAPNPAMMYVYDQHRDLTWLADWNYGLTSGYTGGTDGAATGLMTWGALGDLPGATQTGYLGGTYKTANGWIASLNAGAGLGGFNDWMLPSALNADGTGPCSVFNCTDSVMGHVWYAELGNTAGSLTNTGPFSEVGPNFRQF